MIIGGMMYSDLLTYGDFIQLKNSCNSKELLEEIKDFELETIQSKKKCKQIWIKYYK